MKQIVKCLVISLCFLCSFRFPENSNEAKEYFIKVHFQYSSKPKKEYKETENKWFGGIHGGHVSIEMDSFNFSFLPRGKFHRVKSKKEFHSIWYLYPVKGWCRDTIGHQYLTITIPVTFDQKYKLNELINNYRDSVPYDYAFIGYRCASATYDVLAQIGIVKKLGKRKIFYKYFYPKLLRRKLIKESVNENWELYSNLKNHHLRRWACNY